jgi:hypothetical protein
MCINPGFLQAPMSNFCNSDSGGREGAGERRFGRADGACRRGLRDERLSDAQGRAWPVRFRAESLRRYN